MHNAIHQFEPLLPTLAQPALEQLAIEVATEGQALKRALHPATVRRLAGLLREMNSYYSNRIEGQHTHPRDIERALKHDFDAAPHKARLQRLAVAHIDTQNEMETWLAADPAICVHSAAFLQRLHASFFGRLMPGDRVTKEGDEVVPGEIRKRDVDVGRHVSPDWRTVPEFLARAEQVYGSARGAAQQLIAAACAHHRLAWVHPFRDGNGRVLRLQSQAALLLQGAGSGLWAVSRGFARNVEAYYAVLDEADQPRRGDLDGRGNLSEAGLIAFAKYFLETCLDQIRFMSGVLQLRELRGRMRAYLKLVAETNAEVRAEAEPALHHVLLAGEVKRGEFKRMTGLGDRTADKALAGLLKAGLLASETAKGPVGIGLPLEALAHYFPRLYPEAAA